MHNVAVDTHLYFKISGNFPKISKKYTFRMYYGKHFQI